MTRSPYARFNPEHLILRDELAVDRTLLANERTLLAYLRSAVALMIAGVSMMHFSSERWFWEFGLACVPLGMLVGIVGAVRFRIVSRALAHLRTRSATLADASSSDPQAPLQLGESGQAESAGVKDVGTVNEPSVVKLE